MVRQQVPQVVRISHLIESRSVTKLERRYFASMYGQLSWMCESAPIGL